MADKNVQLKTLDNNKLYPVTKASLVQDLPVYNVAGRGDSKIVRYYIFNSTDNTKKRFTTVNTPSENYIDVFYLTVDNKMEVYKDTSGNPIKGIIVTDSSSNIILKVNDETTTNYIYNENNIYHIVDTNKYKIKEKEQPTTGFTHTYCLVKVDSNDQEIEEVPGSEVNLSGYTRIKYATTEYDEESKEIQVKYKLCRYKDNDTEIEELGTILNKIFIVGKGLQIIQSTSDYDENQIQLQINIGNGLKFDDDNNKLSINLDDSSIIMDPETGKAGLVPSSAQYTKEERDTKVLTASGQWVNGITFAQV